jgi:phosphoribosylformylglycinamidine (FGAM) synthase-like amidotransferase family enzyme
MLPNKKNSKNVLVLYGDGINCEQELGRAFAGAGANVQLVHVSEFLANPQQLLQYHILAFPGGFSFGDELRSGKILAEKIRPAMQKYLKNFLSQKGLVIGVCNGFQVLVQLGVFEHKGGVTPEHRHLTLATNDYGEFRDFWSTFIITEAAANKSPWLAGLGGQCIKLPVRNKEGRLVYSPNNKVSSAAWSVAVQFVVETNGSFERAAGIIDETGQIFGIMPHPEAALESFLYPVEKHAEQNVELLSKIFKNAIQY